MKQTSQAPQVDSRKLSQLVDQLKAMVPHYTPEWPATDPQDSGVALLKIFAFMAEGVINRLNQVPRKNLVAFLDMLGIKLLPARPARVPVQFKLAQGTENEFLVPARTQTTAGATNERPEELPFETEENLWAVPSLLTAVVAVDPQKDAIYKPPPKFLELERAAQSVPPYTIVSFSGKDSDRIQLDRVDGLEKGDFLRTGTKEDEQGRVACKDAGGQVTSASTPEYLVIAEIKGEIVTLIDKLKQDYAADTQVEKLTQFQLFEGWNWQEHVLYLGHSDLFNVKSAAQFTLQITHLAGGELGVAALSLVWEYWGKKRPEPIPPPSPDSPERDDWIMFDIDGDGSQGLSRNGSIVLNKPEGEIKEREVNGIKGRWIRCRLDQAIPNTAFLKLPQLDSIRFLVKSTGQGFPPDQAFHNDTPLDVTTDFLPFGNEPRILDKFYFASREAFSKKGAQITLSVELNQKRGAKELEPKLSWEYWNGRGWVVLKNVDDGTKNFVIRGGKIVQRSGDNDQTEVPVEAPITFQLPGDIDQTEVAGQANFWIRVSLVGGNYGIEEFSLVQQEDRSEENRSQKLVQKLVSDKSQIRPPSIKMAIRYELTEAIPPSHCVTFNNLEYLDQTAACLTPDKEFAPFVGLEDRQKAIYSGFGRSFSGGPVRILFAARELPYSDESKPKLEWTFRSENQWKPVQAEDDTKALTRQEILTLQIPEGFQVLSRFGADLFWVRGSLVEGEYSESPLLSGVFPNTNWSFQAQTLVGETLGSSDGEPDQSFRFLKTPVREGEVVRVREVLSDEEREALTEELGEEAIHEVRNEPGGPPETWVLWSEEPGFLNSNRNKRHYEIDRATGELQFGDGKYGRLPPAGTDNVQAFSYQAGGGTKGNVGAGEVRTLATAVAGVDSVINPVAAGGGSDTATLDQMLVLGPAQISNRGRAVSTEDFEWLALEASREVVKVRCLPNKNGQGQAEIGWVRVVIVPDSHDAQPRPSLALRESVRRYLEVRCDTSLAGQEHIVVDEPEYTRVNVKVEVFADSIDVVSQAEGTARKKLDEFLHPLSGGPEGEGWEFGRDVSASDVYALLEAVEGVDHVENLTFEVDGETSSEVAQIKPNALVASGQHTVTMKTADGG